MREMQKGKNGSKKEDVIQLAKERLKEGALCLMAGSVYIYYGEHWDKYFARPDWGYVTYDGYLYLNHRQKATPKEWEYVIAHLLLHLGLGHFNEKHRNDPVWNAACDLVVTQFLKECKIGTAPAEFSWELPLPAREESQVYEELRIRPGLASDRFCMMSGGRSDMVWTGRKTVRDYRKILADSFTEAMRKAVYHAGGKEGFHPERADGAYMQAREWFISSYPLLGAIAASFTIIADRNIAAQMQVEIAAVDAQMQEIYVNPDRKLSLEEWRFVLAHEFLHAALRHDARCEERHPLLWNVACDLVVNDWLLEMGVGTMPETALYDQKFHGMSAETVYDTIYEEMKEYIKRGGSGDIIRGDEQWWDKLDGAGLDDFYRSVLQQGLDYHYQQNRGLLPNGLVEEIRALGCPPIRWDVALARWFEEQFCLTEPRRTYARMSRRQNAAPDIPMPAWYRTEEPKEQKIFGVVLDTSGSMDRHLLAQALGSIASYACSRDVNYVRVVFCDAAAYDQGVMSPDEIAGTVKVKGRGGTKLQPGIDLLDEDKKFPKDAPLLIITDGKCEGRLNLRGRNHAYLIPAGARLPFLPKGPVFRVK